MKDKIKIIFIALLTVFSIGCVIYASIMQAILSYEKFGVIFSENVFIPHESAWGYLGFLGLMPAYIWGEIGD